MAKLHAPVLAPTADEIRAAVKAIRRNTAEIAAVDPFASLRSMTRDVFLAALNEPGGIGDTLRRVAELARDESIDDATRGARLRAMYGPRPSTPAPELVR